MTASPDWPTDDLDGLSHAQLRKRRDGLNRDINSMRTNSKEYNVAIERLEEVHSALLRKPA